MSDNERVSDIDAASARVFVAPPGQPHAESQPNFEDTPSI